MIKGIVRNLDEVGRATLPSEMRKEVGMQPGNYVDIWLDNGIIRIKSYDKDSVNGIVRKLDKLGRVVLPKENRRTTGMKDNEPVDMWLDGKVICLAPARLQCVSCGKVEELNLIEINGVLLCPDCIRELHEKLSGREKRIEALRNATKGFVKEKDDIEIDLKYTDNVINRKKNQKLEATY